MVRGYILAVAALLYLPLAVSTASAAQTVTAFKIGEKTTGMTKQCYYRFGANEYTRTIQSTQLCPQSIRVGTQPAPSSAPPSSTMGGITAFKTGEKTTGLTKQCYYAFGMSKYTRTMSSTAICPLSIRVEQ